MTIINQHTNFQPLYVFNKSVDRLIIVKDENGNRREYINMTEANAIEQFRRDTKTRWTRYKIFCMNGY